MTVTLQPHPRRRLIVFLLVVGLGMAVAVAGLGISDAVSGGESVQVNNVETGAAGLNPAARRSIFGAEADDVSLWPLRAGAMLLVIIGDGVLGNL